MHKNNIHRKECKHCIECGKILEETYYVIYTGNGGILHTCSYNCALIIQRTFMRLHQQ